MRARRTELVERRCPEHVEDERELVVVVAPGEERPPGQHLGEDAADRPDVDRFLLKSAESGQAVDAPCIA